MKKLITIGCLLGLVISMCGLPLFYAFQKHLHKQSQFNYILHHPQEKMEGLVRITVDEIDNLPMGMNGKRLELNLGIKGCYLI